MADFEETVQAIQRETGVDRCRAEAVARMNGYAPKVEATADSDVLEKAEQNEVMKLFRAFGFKVRNLSQPRATKQAPGLPDLWVMHRERPIAFWFEVKRQVGGRYSDAQIEFRDDCARCGVSWKGGDRRAAEQMLVDMGVACRRGGVLEPMELRR